MFLLDFVLFFFFFFRGRIALSETSRMRCSCQGNLTRQPSVRKSEGDWLYSYTETQIFRWGLFEDIASLHVLKLFNYPSVGIYTRFAHFRNKMSIRGLLNSLTISMNTSNSVACLSKTANHNLSFVLRTVPLQCHVNYTLAAVNCSVACDAINGFWKHWY